MKRIIILPFLILITLYSRARSPVANTDTIGIKPVGIIKNLSDSALLDVVQRIRCEVLTASPVPTQEFVAAPDDERERQDDRELAQAQ